MHHRNLSTVCFGFELTIIQNIKEWFVLGESTENSCFVLSLASYRRLSSSSSSLFQVTIHESNSVPLVTEMGYGAAAGFETDMVITKTEVIVTFARTVMVCL